ncbi:TIGR04282 family arsenosugar biosynthesis glycosyltransferase [soil metagenome]
MSSKSLLIIFTRNPELGKVKTRLAKGVGDQAALDIYKFLLNHTYAITRNLEVDKEVFYSENLPENDIWDPSIFNKELQQGEDLGQKMQHAFQLGFENGYKKLIIIGSDMYDLSSEDIYKAFRSLDTSDFVIGPAEDGGYFLLGMTRLHPQIFQNKAWGTSTVLENTLEDLKNENFTLLDERNDVDHFEDIEHHKDFQQFFQHIKK